MENVFDVLRQGGFSIPKARLAFFVLDSYAYGSSIQEKNLPINSPSESRQATGHFLNQLPHGEFPYLAEAAAAIMASPFDYEREYALGLDLLLEALEAWRARG